MSKKNKDYDKFCEKLRKIDAGEAKLVERQLIEVKEVVLDIVKVKEYNSRTKYVLMADGIPVAITKSMKRCQLLYSYVKGYDVEIADNKVKKALDKYR